ncbi:MAG: hypothetical protein ACLGI9_08075 [Thermoanaerobaculia bacterium]
MTGFRTVRKVAHARASTSAPLASSSIGLSVQTGAGRGLEILFDSPRQRPAGLERAAAADLAATAARLPEALRGRLAVEAGEVLSLLHHEDGEVPLFSRGYGLAICRGVVLGLRDAESKVPFESPWTGTLEVEEMDSSLPVVLAPSATLALVSYALEVTGTHVATRSTAEIPGMTVLDTAASPYPPQHHPFEEDGTPSPSRPLIEEGRWRNREEHAGDDVDPLFFLLTRPDRALRPLAAATFFNRRNLAVGCSREVPGPSPAIVVDSWRVRVGPRSGRVPFEADLSWAGPGGERLAASATVTLQLDPWEVLSHVRGACGPVQPAIDVDPIEGDGHGEAPTLVTDLALADFAVPVT